MKTLNLGTLETDLVKRTLLDVSRRNGTQTSDHQIARKLLRELDDATLSEYKNQTDARSKTVAVLLALFLGGIGAHKFYLKQTGWGIFYLLFCWTYIPAIFGLVEAISLALYTQENFDRRFNS